MTARRVPFTWPRSSDEARVVEWEVRWLFDLLDIAAGPPIDPARLPDERSRRAQERYLAWLARDLRLGQSRREQQRTAAQARSVVARAFSEAAARMSGIAAVSGSPSRESIESSPADRVLIESMTLRGRSLIVPHGVAAGVGRDLSGAECDECVVLPQGLPQAHYVAIPVVGDSMTPAMHDGDVVLVKLGPAVVRGTVVVARHPEDGYVVKRVGTLRQDSIELQSLNPSFAPLRIPRDAQLILGTVVLRWCAHGDVKRA